MYNSPEERAMIQALAAQPATCRRSSSASARTCPRNPQPARFRQKYDIRGPFAVYVGRIDENKGCKELFDFFERYLARRRRTADARADRPFAARRSRRIRGFAISGSSTTPTSSTRIAGVGAPDHAVVLREPVDGGARSVGARPSGARQREMRRAEGSVHPQQRRAVLRRRARSSSRRCARSNTTAGWPAASAGTAASSIATTTTGRSSSGSISTCSSGCRRRRRRRRIEPSARLARAAQGRLPARRRRSSPRCPPARRSPPSRTSRGRSEPVSPPLPRRAPAPERAPAARAIPRPPLISGATTGAAASRPGGRR